MATEGGGMKFPAPGEVHDYQFLGETFRERERIKRKKARWAARLERMPGLERQALLMAIQELRCSSAGSSDESGGDIALPGGDAGTGDGRRQASADGAGVASSAVPGGDGDRDDVDMITSAGEAVGAENGGYNDTDLMIASAFVDMGACIGGNGVCRPGGEE